MLLDSGGGVERRVVGHDSHSGEDPVRGARLGSRHEVQVHHARSEVVAQIQGALDIPVATVGQGRNLVAVAKTRCCCNQDIDGDAGLAAQALKDPLLVGLLALAVKARRPCEGAANQKPDEALSLLVRHCRAGVRSGERRARSCVSTTAVIIIIIGREARRFTRRVAPSRHGRQLTHS